MNIMPVMGMRNNYNFAFGNRHKHLSEKWHEKYNCKFDVNKSDIFELSMDKDKKLKINKNTELKRTIAKAMSTRYDYKSLVDTFLEKGTINTGLDLIEVSNKENTSLPVHIAILRSSPENDLFLDCSVEDLIDIMKTSLSYSIQQNPDMKDEYIKANYQLVKKLKNI